MTLIEPAIVERVEVVKGSGSVQYGSDAMTGVINIKTTTLDFRDKSSWQEKLMVRNTSQGMEFSVRPELKYEGKKFAFVLGASHKKFGDLKGGDTTGFQRPSGYGEKSADLKFKIDLGRQWTLTAATHWLAQSSVPVYHKYKLENFALNTSDPIGRGFEYVQLEKIINKKILKSFNAFLSGQQISETRYMRKNGAALTRKERDQVSTLSSGMDVELKFNRYWSSNSGIEFYLDRLNSSRSDANLTTGSTINLRGLYPNQSSYLNTAAYSMHHLQYGGWNMEAGLRFNAYKASITDTTLGKVVLSPQALVFQWGLNRTLFRGANAYFSISEGFRAPNLDDLGTLGIVDFRYEIPKYDLKPERSFNRELGLKYSGRNWNAKGALFRTDLKGLITRVSTSQVITGYTVYTKENVDQAFIRGWELETDWQPAKGLQLLASATNLYGQNETKNQPLRRVPPFYARLSGQQRIGSFNLGIIFDHASSQRRLEAGDKADNRIPAGGTPGFNIVHISGGYQSEKLTFRLHWNNIFNADYRMHGSGINGMGNSLSAMLLLQLNQGYDK